MINEDIILTMVNMAKDAMANSYVPYSHEASGACLLASDGTLYGGCAIENASLGLSCCAGRVALFKAVADYKRDFDAIAVVADTPEPRVPCGACCQALAEFGIRDIIMANTKGDVDIADLMDIAPCTSGKRPPQKSL